jgi:hypothetical protein
MELNEFITQVVDRGLKAAVKSPGSRAKGTISGFEACRGRNVDELRLLYDQAVVVRNLANETGHTYWALQGYMMAMYHVCACVSVMMSHAGQKVIVVPDHDAIRTTTAVLGVSV